MLLQVRDDLLSGADEQFIEEEQVLDTLRMGEHTSLVLLEVEVEVLRFGICPFRYVRDIPVQPAQM